MPFRFQLAIQGGGAKIASLLAAASAVQGLRRNQPKTIELTRVVGTSAGAIVAALLAADVDLEQFRRRLREGAGALLLPSFGRPNLFHLVRLGWNGSPIWDETHLERFLKREFDAQGVTTLADIREKFGVEVVVVSADLSASAPAAEAKDKPIVKALLNSCGLPFLFRTWKTGPIVDGGIAQNFPWAELADNSEGKDFGPILGIMFDRAVPNGSPQNLFHYSASLLDTAMSSATERARQSLGKSQIFSIPNRLDTFDFKTAIEVGLADHFDRTRDRATDWFSDYVQDPGAVRGDIWSGENMSTMTKTAQMYRQQHSKSPIRYRQCSMIFRANGLAETDKPDVVEYRMEFETLDERIYCHKLALSQSDYHTGFRKSSWQMFDQTTRKQIEVSYVPIMDSQTPAKREVLVYFDPVLEKNRKYSLEVVDSVRGLSLPLREKGRDEMQLELTRTEEPIGRVEIVVFLPDSEAWKNARFVGNPGACMGDAMTDWELRGHRSVPGFRRPIGWSGSMVPPGYSFGPTVQL